MMHVSMSIDSFLILCSAISVIEGNTSLIGLGDVVARGCIVAEECSPSMMSLIEIFMASEDVLRRRSFPACVERDKLI
jgi:hypothetical protein